MQNFTELMKFLIFRKHVKFEVQESVGGAGIACHAIGCMHTVLITSQTGESGMRYTHILDKVFIQ